MVLRAEFTHVQLGDGPATAIHRRNFNARVSRPWLATIFCMVVPRPLLQYSRESVESQREQWRRDKLPLFADGHRELYDDLVAHDEAAGGIARSFIHSWVSDGADDPVGLLLLAMVWGWGKDNRGPSNTRRMLEQEGSTDRLREIVGATRACLPIHWPLRGRG